MGVQTVVLRLLQPVWDDILAGAIAAAPGAAGALNAAHVGLLVDAPPWALDMDATAATEADFDGYARKPVVWGTIGHAPSKRSKVPITSIRWTKTAGIVSNVIRAVGLFSAITAGDMLAVAYLGTPVEIVDELTPLDLHLVLMMPGTESPDQGEVTTIQ